ncbi:MAG: nucleotidyltransferase family protein [Candidatus Omnitrophica bacterium]|nr:nucleotidyltransferase family protein [Candidatus Omnitrophota bacterium]
MRDCCLSSEYNLLFLCTRVHIDTVTAKEIAWVTEESLSWDTILTLAKKQEIVPFLYSAFQKLELLEHMPASILSIARNYYYANLNRNILFEKDILGITARARLQGIEIIPLKGFSLLYSLYQENPALRIMTDVDILVKEEDFQDTKRLLAQSGYRTIAEDGYEYLVAKDVASGTPLYLELHNALVPARPHPVIFPLLWKRKRTQMVHGQKMYFLSDEDMLLSLAVHIRRHTRRLTLKFIVDIAELLKKSDDTLDWDYILANAQHSHCVMSVYFSLYLAQEILNTSIPPAALHAFRPWRIKEKLLRLALNKNNFLSLGEKRGTIIRILLFDRISELFLYLRHAVFFPTTSPKEQQKQ